MVYQWQYFIDLHNKRQAGMSINPISWSDIRAYFSLIQYQPYQWEIELIAKLDNVVLQVHHEQQEKEQKKNKK